MKTLILVLLLVLNVCLTVWSAFGAEEEIKPERVTFRGDDGQMLEGDIWKPAGKGPFPTLIWNHGSFKKHGGMRSERLPANELVQEPPLAKFYNSHGYLIFFPSRHGKFKSPDYTGDMLSREQDLKDHHDIVGLHEFWNLDVQAAVRFIKTRSDVDTQRLIVTGYSYGGIQTLLTAERGLGIRAAVCFAPGAESWNDGRIRALLKQAVRNARMPIFLLQAENDASTGPSEVLGPMLLAKGPPNAAKLYPPYGVTARNPEGDGHRGFSVRGEDVWGADVLNFLNRVLEKTK